MHQHAAQPHTEHDTVPVPLSVIHFVNMAHIC